MTIRIHRYELQGVGRLNAQSKSKTHSGCLFKITFKDGSVGYADCHPWPELGDFPLDMHLHLLIQGHLTRITERSFAYAFIDAKHRKQGISAFAHLKIPPSQILFTELTQLTPDYLKTYSAQGYPTIKVKGSIKDLAALKMLLASIKETPLKLRVDYNCSLRRGEFEEVLKELKPYLELIDFFEDPIPFHLESWRQLQQHEGITLACDKDALKAVGFPEAAKVVVVKPALYNLDRFQGTSQTIVVTSYMDHPLGQAAAAWAAASFSGKVGICGLLTQYAYQPTPFSEQLIHTGPWLSPPVGTGFGFDHLLENLDWNALYVD